MNKIIILAVAVGFCAFGLYIVVERSTGSSQEHEAGHGSHALHAATIDSERAFLEHMIPHHQEAVDSANFLLERGATLRPLQELAETIVSAQSAEIEQMKSWYLDWYEIGYEDTGVYAPMMRSFENVSGAMLDRLFLEDMILHHEGAIVAARQVLTVSRSQETTELAENIIMTQEEEIEQMRELLRLLPQ